MGGDAGWVATSNQLENSTLDRGFQQTSMRMIDWRTLGPSDGHNFGPVTQTLGRMQFLSDSRSIIGRRSRTDIGRVDKGIRGEHFDASLDGIGRSIREMQPLHRRSNSNTVDGWHLSAGQSLIGSNHSGDNSDSDRRSHLRDPDTFWRAVLGAVEEIRSVFNGSTGDPHTGRRIDTHWNCRDFTGTTITEPSNIGEIQSGTLHLKLEMVNLSTWNGGRLSWDEMGLSPFLKSCVIEGVHFPFINSPPRIRIRNHVPVEHFNFMDDRWEEWKAKGLLERGEVWIIMALGTAPKKGGKIRPTHDCRPLNECVPDMPFKFDALGEAAKFIKRGDWMAKIDLKEGYEHISIHPEWRKFFGTAWRGEVLRFARLGYGFKLSPVIFQKLMESVAAKTNDWLGWKAIFVVLDDFLIRGPTQEECHRAIHRLRAVLCQLELRINVEKSLLVPCQRMEYIGKVWDTVSGEVGNTEEKAIGVSRTCEQTLRRGTCTISTLESLLGRMEWLARTLQHSRCWKRCLLMELQVWKRLEGDRGTGLGVSGGPGGDFWSGRGIGIGLEVGQDSGFLGVGQDFGLGSGQDLGLGAGQGWRGSGGRESGSRTNSGDGRTGFELGHGWGVPGLGAGQAFRNETEWRISPASRRELKWWKEHATNWLPVEIDDVWRVRHNMVFTDSSDFAFGATNGMWGRWVHDEVDWNIAIKELESVRRLICTLNNGTRCTVYCDNSVAFWSLIKGRSFSLDINELIKRIGGDAFKRNLHLRFRWVPSEDNVADWISRSGTRPIRVRFGDGFQSVEGESMPDYGSPGVKPTIQP